jgi:hypothetical protein
MPGVAGSRKKESVMLSAAKHLLCLIENKESRSFALLGMKCPQAFPQPASWTVAWERLEFAQPVYSGG